ncbi:hypothetical protein VTK56DRAFT_3358 [Thermocarpiscus australiensis]
MNPCLKISLLMLLGIPNPALLWPDPSMLVHFSFSIRFTVWMDGADLGTYHRSLTPYQGPPPLMPAARIRDQQLSIPVWDPCWNSLEGCTPQWEETSVLA